MATYADYLNQWKASHPDGAGFDSATGYIQGDRGASIWDSNNPYGATGTEASIRVLYPEAVRRGYSGSIDDYLTKFAETANKYGSHGDPTYNYAARTGSYWQALSDKEKLALSGLGFTPEDADREYALRVKASDEYKASHPQDAEDGLGGIGKLAALAALIYSGGSAAGLWGAAEGAGAAGLSDIAAGDAIWGGGPGTYLSGEGAAGFSDIGLLPSDQVAALDSIPANGTFGNYNWPTVGGGETGIQSGFNLANAAGNGVTGITGEIPGLGTLTESGMLIPAAGGSAIALSSASPGVLRSISDWIRSTTGGSITPAQIAAGGLNAVGGLLSGRASQGAANTAANAQLEAARIAAEAAKFRPIGITTRFGTSQFTKDANGNVTGAGYTLTPDMKAQQDALIGISNQALTQYQNAPGMFAPMGAAGQRAMTLGNQYLAQDPQAQALKYMQDQQTLLATGRDRDMNNMLTGEFNRGTYGLATGATGQMGAANPRLEALMNAQRQQDLGLAAQATQGGMDYAKFGAGLVGTGGDLTKGMFAGQTAAYAPYQQALQGAQYIEGLGQQPLTMGIDIGKQTSNAASGGLLANGMMNAAQTQQNASYSPWGTLLMGAGNAVQNYQNQQAQQAQNQAFIDAMKTWGK